jgi:4-hydroxybenzoate polyprenyltransferase
MSGSDVIYALQDLRSDRRTGVRSLPASLGERGASIVAAGLHVAAAGALAMLWVTAGRGWAGAAAMAVSLAALLLANVPAIPAAKRFFPISAAASVAGALVALV